MTTPELRMRAEYHSNVIEEGGFSAQPTPSFAPAFREEKFVSTSRAELLYLDQDAVLAADVLDMPRALNVMAEALTLVEEGNVRQPPKMVLRNGDNAECEVQGRINGLCASMRGSVRALGIKWIASFPNNRARGIPRASALLILNCPDTGLPLALMDGTLISAMRTGAMTALGTRYLAPRNTRKIGMIGAGVQSHTQILGLFTAVPRVEEIAIFNRTRERAEVVAEECQRRWGAPVVTVETIEKALTDADVAVTVTSAHEPLMRVQHIKPGALTIQLAGHECEYAVIQQCQKIVADNWEECKHRGIMTPALMHAQGLLRDGDIYANLSELVVGRKPPRENESERIHFFHVGRGVYDVALGWSVYETARQRCLGQPLTLWREPLWA